jgi:EpsD family peptidyl-prolyl cis-trans isomerase
MISRIDARAFIEGQHRARRLMLIASCLLAVAAAGCGGSKDKATQTAAKVNKEEITVHQINYVLQQQRGVPPAQSASAGQQVLERLIDQELAVQTAKTKDIDRDPRVVQQIEAAKREIIARAYIERVGSGASKPSAEDIKKYYDEKPALFSQRHVYNVQELRIEATPEQVAELRNTLQESAGIDEVTAFLKEKGYKFGANQAVLAAEQVPLGSLDSFAGMKEGQSVIHAVPGGAQVVTMIASRSQPLDESQAGPAIEQFLLNERKRRIVEEDLKALRAAAKIRYLGDYAKGAPSAAEKTDTLAVKVPSGN